MKKKRKDIGNNASKETPLIVDQSARITLEDLTSGKIDYAATQFNLGKSQEINSLLSQVIKPTSGLLNRTTTDLFGTTTDRVTNHNRAFQLEALRQSLNESSTEEKINKLFKEQKQEVKEQLEEVQRLLNEGLKKDVENERVGLELLEEKLNNHFVIDWYCKGCGTFIESFRGSQGLNKIKSYLAGFKTKKYKVCPKKDGQHLNWFEVKEQSILWYGLSLIESICKIDKKNPPALD